MSKVAVLDSRAERKAHLVRTLKDMLEKAEADDLVGFYAVCDFESRLATYQSGFSNRQEQIGALEMIKFSLLKP